MASTDQVREWYQETILNHDQRGTSGYEPQCDWRNAVRVDFPNQSGGHYSEPVHPATEEAWKVYVRLMDLHGVEMSGAGGVNQCRNIAGTNWPSLHAYLVACDLPPNPYKPQAFIDDVLRVRTNSGQQVFLNGAIFNDRMHDQINCSQPDLATGIDPTSLPFQEEDMPLTDSDVDRVATAVVSRVLTDSANYADPPGLGRQVQLIRSTANQTEAIARSILKAVNQLDDIDTQALAADIAAELGDSGGFDSDAAAQAFIDKLVAELTD